VVPRAATATAYRRVGRCASAGERPADGKFANFGLRDERVRASCYNVDQWLGRLFPSIREQGIFLREQGTIPAEQGTPKAKSGMENSKGV
jgi:hypothetical protein